MKRSRFSGPSLLTQLTLLALLVLPACGGPTGESATQPIEVPSYSIGQFLETTNYRGNSFSSDNSRVLVSSDRSGVYNAYAIPTSGGDPSDPVAPVALTDSEESVFVISYFPEDDRFLYSADQGGNEQDHVYVRETDGTVVDLTPGEELRATFVDFAADGDSFFVATNERDQRFFDLYEFKTDGYARGDVFQNDAGYRIADVSGDGRFVALMLVFAVDK